MPSLLTPVALLVLAAGTAHAQESPLADFFGFEELEVIKIDNGAGPLVIADMNADGLQDVVVVNNHASRIELHLQRGDAKPGDEVVTLSRPNEIPEHWRFERKPISVTHRVQAVVPHDFNADGRMDLVYAGSPGEIVFLRQTSTGRFVLARKHRVRELAANRNGLAITDVMGDDAPELLALAGGKIRVWPLDADDLGKPTVLAAGSDLVAFMLADYDGDGRDDIAAVLPDDPAPVRLWLGRRPGEDGALGAQVRYEMPALIELQPVTLPGNHAASVAVIERASKRLVVYDMVDEPITDTGNRDVAIEVFSFSDPANRERALAVIDLDGNGLLDLVATDTRANELVAYPQVKGEGIQPGLGHPSYADLKTLVAGNVDDDPYAEVFVLSEKEGVVGRSDVTSAGIPYPVPLKIPDGTTPVTINLVQLDGGPRLAVVVKKQRDYSVVLLDMNGGMETVDLGKLSRSPDTIVALDADQSGRTDLLLFTREKPMMMLQAGDDGFELIESKDMGQYGLVKAASADNTAVFDIDADGKPELLVANRNFVRAVRYEPDPPAGVSPGWQVVEQINAADGDSKLVSLALLGDRIVAADKANDRLVVLGREGDRWTELEALNVTGFTFSAIHAGALSGDGSDAILAVGDDGFGVIRLAGAGLALHELAAWRTDEEARRQHELTPGDVNGDGFMDLVSLDAGEQMCEILTFTDAHELLYVTGFQVFESKLFSGGEAREFEPSQLEIGDVTGDGAADLVLMSHDRVLIYPQMTAESQARR